MLRSKRIYYWPLEDKKKIIIEDEPEIKLIKDFKNVIKQEENLD